MTHLIGGLDRGSRKQKLMEPTFVCLLFTLVAHLSASSIPVAQPQPQAGWAVSQETDIMTSAANPHYGIKYLPSQRKIITHLGPHRQITITSYSRDRRGSVRIHKSDGTVVFVIGYKNAELSPEADTYEATLSTNKVGSSVIVFAYDSETVDHLREEALKLDIDEMFYGNDNLSPEETEAAVAQLKTMFRSEPSFHGKWVIFTFTIVHNPEVSHLPILPILPRPRNRTRHGSVSVPNQEAIFSEERYQSQTSADYHPNQTEDNKRKSSINFVLDDSYVLNNAPPALPKPQPNSFIRNHKRLSVEDMLNPVDDEPVRRLDSKRPSLENILNPVNDNEDSAMPKPSRPGHVSFSEFLDLLRDKDARDTGDYWKTVMGENSHYQKH